MADYATICQGLTGTYLDTKLSEEARLDQLVEAVAKNLTELTRQLVNNAVSLTGNPSGCLVVKLRHAFAAHNMQVVMQGSIELFHSSSIEPCMML